MMPLSDVRTIRMDRLTMCFPLWLLHRRGRWSLTSSPFRSVWMFPLIFLPEFKKGFFEPVHPVVVGDGAAPEPSAPDAGLVEVFLGPDALAAPDALSHQNTHAAIPKPQANPSAQ